MKNETYMKQGLDLKRLVLVLGRKLWLLLAGLILGAFIGGITYKIVTNITNGEPKYRASADYYISFFGDGVDYYNAYTWDGILRDDPIVDYALTLLPEEITKEMVKAAVSGEMLGDYRILTVHVNAPTKEMADTIAKAYEESLWHFGQEMDLLDKVELWSQEEAIPFEKNNKTMNAAFLGALIVGLLVAFGLLFYYVLEDAVYVERDAKERFGLPVYGLLTKGNDELQRQMFSDNIGFLLRKDKELEDNQNVKLSTAEIESWNAEVIPTTEVESWNAEVIPTAEDCKHLRSAENVLLNIPWGRNNGRQVERVLRQLEIQKVEVKGILITEADDKFIRAYYMIERDKKRKSI